MSVLPDHQIAWYSEAIGLIDPFEEDQLQPASYDVRLASAIRVPHQRSHHPIDLRKPPEDRTDLVDIGEGYRLDAGRFVLGSTVERVRVPDSLVGRVEGKSTRARQQIQIHAAGYLDPGFRGNVTLEIVNFGPDSVILWPGVLIAQFAFEELVGSCERPYSLKRNHYQGSDGTVGAR